MNVRTAAHVVMLVVGTFSLAASCKPPVKGCKPKPPRIHIPNVAEAVERANHRLDDALSSLSTEDAGYAKDIVCVGIDAYYGELDWEDAFAPFGPASAQLRNAATEIQGILSSAIGAREQFLRSTCSLPFT